MKPANSKKTMQCIEGKGARKDMLPSQSDSASDYLVILPSMGDTILCFLEEVLA